MERRLDVIASTGRNLCFLVSTPRAGSTVLGAMLGSLPGVVCPPEPWIQLLLGSLDPGGPETEAVYDHRLALEAVTGFAPSTRVRERLRELAGGLYNDVLARHGGTLFVDKTPRYYHILSYLAELWPEARFVWVRRNPLDVVASCKETWSIPVAEQMGERVTPHTYDTTLAFARLREFFRPGFAAGDADRKISLRYEDLVAAPEPAMRSVCEALGLPFDPRVIEYGRNRALVSAYRASRFGDKKTLEHAKPHGGSVGQWEQRLTSAEVRLVLETLGSRCFSDQGYDEELRRACRLSGANGDTLPAEGTWAGKLQRADEIVLTQAGGSPFSSMRLVGRQLGEIKALREQLARLTQDLTAVCADRDQAANERNLAVARLNDLQEKFASAEVDRAERGNLIKQQGAVLSKLEAEFDTRLKELSALYPAMETLRNERNLLHAQLADVRQRFEVVEQDRHARGTLIEQQGTQVAKLEAEVDARLKELSALYPAVEAAKNERNLLHAQLADLRRNFDAVEEDRIARGEVIQTQGDRVAELQRLVFLTEQNRDFWKAEAERRAGLQLPPPSGTT